MHYTILSKSTKAIDTCHVCILSYNYLLFVLNFDLLGNVLYYIIYMYLLLLYYIIEHYFFKVFSLFIFIIYVHFILFNRI